MTTAPVITDLDLRRLGEAKHYRAHSLILTRPLLSILAFQRGANERPAA